MNPIFVSYPYSNREKMGTFFSYDLLYILVSISRSYKSLSPKSDSNPSKLEKYEFEMSFNFSNFLLKIKSPYLHYYLKLALIFFYFSFISNWLHLLWAYLQ